MYLDNVTMLMIYVPKFFKMYKNAVKIELL